MSTSLCSLSISVTVPIHGVLSYAHVMNWPIWVSAVMLISWSGFGTKLYTLSKCSWSDILFKPISPLFKRYKFMVAPCTRYCFLQKHIFLSFYIVQLQYYVKGETYIHVIQTTSFWQKVNISRGVSICSVLVLCKLGLAASLFSVVVLCSITACYPVSKIWDGLLGSKITNRGSRPNAQANWAKVSQESSHMPGDR